MEQGRWVSYVYRYRNNVRCENAGFIKIQRLTRQTEDEARIQMGVKLYKTKACKCMAYLLYGNKRARYLADIFFKEKERDTIMKRVEIPWDNPLGDGKPFEEYDGILFVCEDGEVLAGMWNEYPIITSGIVFEDLSVKTDEAAIADEAMNSRAVYKGEYEAVHEKDMHDEEVYIEDEYDREMHGEEVYGEDEYDRDVHEWEISDQDVTAEIENEETVAEYRDDSLSQAELCACKEMIDTCQKLPLFPGSQIVECVKIVPQDIGKLSMGNWALGKNSFLTHGYYHYRYIMLGKVLIDNEEKYVIGVPGVYTNKERYLANMFGFSQFVPVKKCKIFTGNFGYWIVEVSRE